MAIGGSLIGRSWRQANRLYLEHGHYSRIADRLNRLPLFRAFVEASGSVPSFPTREALWDEIASRYTGAIDYLEFGVNQGHSILHWARANAAPDSRFVGFDTFEGLPESWNSHFPAGHFDQGGSFPRTEDHRVRFIKGLFQDSLVDFLSTFHVRGPLVVHIDCDLYSSTLYCLTKLDDILTPGTVIIFDEFGDVQHEFRALMDYLASYRRRARLIASHDRCFTAAAEIM